MKRVSPALAPLLGWLVLAAVSAGAILLTRPPAPLPADASPTSFSAERAMQHVERVALRPHAWGTAANREVRLYLEAQLTELGFEVDVQRTHHGLPVSVENVLALRRGTQSTGLVVLCAHYDSTVFGPGAGDDGAAVGALLETARAITIQGAPRNDLLLLITDGEEAGLLGAAAFTEAHPLAAEVSIVLNFEARGNAGRSLMFETSPGNRDLVSIYADVVPRPAACSLMTAFYRLMPRTTDFAVFRKHGVPGLNFAFIDGAVHYHAKTDTPANLSRASLQHHGQAMLGLARRLGEIDLERLSHDDDATYFDLLGRVFILYPAYLDWPLTLLALLLVLAVFRRAWTRGELDLRGLGYGVWAGLRVLAFCAILAAGLGYAILNGVSDHVSRGARATASDSFFFVALVLLFHVCGVVMARSAARRAGGPALAAGLVAIWALLLATATVGLPGSAFLLTWPLFLVLPAVAVVLRRPAPALTTLCLVPVALLFAPLALLLLQGMGLALAVVHAPLFGLFLGLAAALLDRDGIADRRLLVGLPAVLAAGLLLLGLLRL